MISGCLLRCNRALCSQKIVALLISFSRHFNDDARLNCYICFSRHSINFQIKRKVEYEKINYALPQIFIFLCYTSLLATDTIHKKQAKTPILIEREDNVLFYFCIDASEFEMLNELKLTFSNNTTQAQQAEVALRDLMLNTRDNRGGSRAVATTTDLGQTWSEHPSSCSVLQEPVCMASLIKVETKDNAFGKDIVLFSNPITTNGRHHITY